MLGLTPTCRSPFSSSRGQTSCKEGRGFRPLSRTARGLMVYKRGRGSLTGHGVYPGVPRRIPNAKTKYSPHLTTSNLKGHPALAAMLRSNPTGASFHQDIGHNTWAVLNAISFSVFCATGPIPLRTRHLFEPSEEVTLLGRRGCLCLDPRTHPYPGIHHKCISQKTQWRSLHDLLHFNFSACPRNGAAP